MRSSAVLSVFVAFATAQIGSSSTRVVPTSIGNVVPSATQTVSGPISTGSACAQIADAVANARSRYPSVQASLAYACLKSVPISTDEAALTITSIKQMAEFQSTISYLKDPPEGWANEAVDIMAGLDDIGSKVQNGDYTNEFDFETDIATLFIKAHDGHFGFDGMVFGGTLVWRRSSNIALISASRDGSELPEIWALRDFNRTITEFEPSPVTQIDGQDVVHFLQEESNMNSYHDPDTRYNAMFFMQSAENFGYFTSPRFYPGDTTNITYENGTTDTYRNAAMVVQPDAWSYVSDPESFYETFVSPQTSAERVRKRDPNLLPRHLENPRDHEFHGSSVVPHGSVPALYPEPAVAHSAPDTPLAGYFINTDAGEIGVLMVQTFNTPDVQTTIEFQSVVQEYIAQAKSRGVEKHIIDVRTNGGGKVMLGYDMYMQFFPSQEPQTQSRYRGHAASALFGEKISSITRPTLYNVDVFASPFSNDAYLSTNLTDIPTWSAMYPPTTFHNDTFTTLLKYNLSDPLTTSNTRVATGITITGYAARANFTTDPFRAQDIVILSDGICASTCTIFTELMAQQSHVRTLTIGGRPNTGPMQHAGGTKGTLVLPADYLHSIADYVTSAYASDREEAASWAEFLPAPFAIASTYASVNFQDNIRVGLESGGVPSQFLNDSSSCRVWYEPGMFHDVGRVWDKVARVAFGNQGALDEGACVAGSVASEEQQSGQGAGNSGTGAGSGREKKGAASGVRPAGWMGVLVVVAVGVMGVLG
ncbi:peptidase S41 family protein [Dothidotthia symphoricarpi CBS 119687]|uniref:Peptidase S41 family protein n=1 Tax=Dothidotthia symphoricarpi CBS 119687 TaxID=1392245 RepID=A0A6A6A260_9PLEO|nr:peptidase S41 family protein [Dothidotthia symphoricarpi CBS 119687]KAF2125285.1 peptidase S41 family protein [Dothidotthia symphoricarpi CBS 119687]